MIKPQFDKQYLVNNEHFPWMDEKIDVKWDNLFLDTFFADDQNQDQDQQDQQQQQHTHDHEHSHEFNEELSQMTDIPFTNNQNHHYNNDDDNNNNSNNNNDNLVREASENKSRKTKAPRPKPEDTLLDLILPKESEQLHDDEDDKEDLDANSNALHYDEKKLKKVAIFRTEFDSNAVSNARIAAQREADKFIESRRESLKRKGTPVEILEELDLQDLEPDQLKDLKHQQRLFLNRESAAVSRVRRKRYLTELEKHCTDLEKRNQALTDELLLLRSENMALTFKLENQGFTGLHTYAKFSSDAADYQHSTPAA